VADSATGVPAGDEPGVAALGYSAQ
jgi:hypothetical protein